MAYCTSPGWWLMVISVKQSKEYLTYGTEVLGENLHQCRFVHHKSHITTKARTWAAEVGNWRLVAWVMVWPRIWFILLKKANLRFWRQWSDLYFNCWLVWNIILPLVCCVRSCYVVKLRKSATLFRSQDRVHSDSNFFQRRSFGKVKAI
jgi:hypothetical protein